MRASVHTVFLAACLALLAPAVAADKANSLQVDYPASTIEIRAKAAGFFPATFHFDSFEADLSFTADGNKLENASFSFNYGTITSGSKSKDRKVREWLETESYPNGHFTLNRLEEEDGQFFAIGQLTLHGKARPAKFSYEIEGDGDQRVFRALAVIDYRDWDLPELWVLFFKIQHDLEIGIDISGTLPPPSAIK